MPYYLLSRFDDGDDYSSNSYNDDSDDVDAEIQEDFENPGGFFGRELHDESKGEKDLTGGMHLFHGVKSALEHTFGSDWAESSAYADFRASAEALLVARTQKKLSAEQFETSLKQNPGVSTNLRKFIEVPPFKGVDSKRYAGILKVMARGVKYLNEQQRKKYQIDLGPVLTRGPNSVVFDTASVLRHKSETSMVGSFATNVFPIKDEMLKRCMWVMTEREHVDGYQFYSHVGKVARFHHSSFAGGEQVQAAGEWYVKDGKVLLINGLSGHYRPEAADLMQALNVLKASNVLAGAVVQLFDKSTRRENRVDALQYINYAPMLLKNNTLF